MRKIFLVIFIAVTTISCRAQPDADSFADDFQIFKKALLQSHPSLYRFTSENRFTEVLDSIEHEITSETTDLQFFKMLSKVEAMIREGHSYILPHKHLIKTAQSKPLFPFSVWASATKLTVTNSRVKELSDYIGSEIIAINGESIADLIKTLEHNTGGKTAFNNSGLISTLSLYNNFAFAYYFFVDTTSQFQITYLNRNDSAKTTTIRGTNHYLPQDNIFQMPEEPEPPFAFTIDKTRNTATLKITTFAYWVVSSKQKDYLKFFDSCFAAIEASNIENLIIDVRNNRGGEEKLAAELLTYLMDDDLKLYKYVKAQTLDFDYTNSLPKSNKLSFSKKDFIETDSGYYLTKGEPLKTFYPKTKNHFNGSTYILSNSISRSAAHIFLVLAKSYKVGTIIGSESAGAFEDIDGRWRVKFRLPYSKNTVSYPAWSLKINSKNGNKFSGVIPDFTITNTTQSILSQEDVALQFAYDLIEKNHTIKK